MKPKRTNWVSEEKAAEIAGVAPRTIRYWRLKGWIAAEDTMAVLNGAKLQRVYAAHAIREIKRNGIPQ